MRLSAGEALATVFEVGCEFREDFGDNLKDELIEILRQLATDSHKYRAKKDRKQQRATFRDVLHYIEVKFCFLVYNKYIFFYDFIALFSGRRYI